MNNVPVTIENKNNIAMITVDNPPVNAVSHAVRSRLLDRVTAAATDADIAGIVIVCAGRTFIAGADITEFGKPPKNPSLRDLIAAIERIEKPTLAAVHGTALGGGLELALACRYRVAHEDAKFGLPEVKLGLIPGAGGTVSLPRLIGPIPALNAIVSGNPMATAPALELGLVDAATASDLIPFAISFLEDKIATGEVAAPVSARNAKIDDVDLTLLDEKIAILAKKARGLEAPIACAQAVRNAVVEDFETALVEERVLFDRLMSGTQSKAQRHLFFAERASTKVPGLKGVQARPIEKVGVIGSGTMGGGIAMAFANAGLPVTIVDMSDEALERGKKTIEKNYGVSVKRGSLTQAEMSERQARFSYASDFTALADCDLIVEAAFEDIDVKKDIFGQLDKIAKPSAILASNTSYLDIDEIAAATTRPENVVGMHFFSPANIMRLLELVRGAKTAADILVTAMKIGKKIGKVPVVVGICRGFVGNRMLGARSTDMVDLLLEGATPAQVDKVFIDFGWPMGPFQMQDLAGLDISWRNRKSLGQKMPIADDLCELGHFGQKTGRGYYTYEEGARKPLEDPEVLRLIAAKAKIVGIEQRDISDEEILERTHFPLINEGAHIIAEGVAARWSDIDLVWVHGYGFPKGKGGPMFWAETFGLSKIVEKLEYWHAETGKPVFAPAKKLREAAAADRFVVADNG